MIVKNHCCSASLSLALTALRNLSLSSCLFPLTFNPWSLRISFRRFTVSKSIGSEGLSFDSAPSEPVAPVVPFESKRVSTEASSNSSPSLGISIGSPSSSRTSSTGTLLCHLECVSMKGNSLRSFDLPPFDLSSSPVTAANMSSVLRPSLPGGGTNRPASMFITSSAPMLSPRELKGTAIPSSSVVNSCPSPCCVTSLTYPALPSSSMVLCDIFNPALNMLLSTLLMLMLSMSTPRLLAYSRTSSSSALSYLRSDTSSSSFGYTPPQSYSTTSN
mmetsp:Transcript_26512/g.76531  ORF Transcript_26512/g.76531 Transcript_26512/m.76531 type:complete len:274 (-) Transcript_26512:441-1262(-)